MGTLARILTAGILGLTLLSMVGAAWVYSLLWFPEETEPAPLTCPDDTPLAPKGEPLTVLVWNVQYAGSRKHHFFYDGGQAVHVPEADVLDTLDGLERVVRELDPDLVLWQELDRGSDRTHRIDQYARLQQALGHPCHASAPYHHVGYVPTPGHEHMGKVSMHLGVFSRYRLESATRHQLALLDEPAWRQAFNLRRAVLDVRMPLQGGGTLRLFDTHLSAFSKGDGTLGRQIAELDQLAQAASADGHAWILAGDLNSLPPGDDPARLGEDAQYYADGTTPVQPLFDRHRSAFPLARLGAEPQATRTYVPFGADAPDRVLDYAFVSDDIEVRSAEVVPETSLSDHLPLSLQLVVRP